MRCYFLRAGQVAGVNMLAFGLSDQDAIARAEKLCAKRKGPLTASRSGTVLVWSYEFGSEFAGRVRAA